MAYDNNNSGCLYKNERKQQEYHADKRGFLKIEGVEHWLDGFDEFGDNEADDLIRLTVQKKDTHGDNKGKGEIKRTDNTGKSDRYPDWKGWVETAAGKKFWVSAWKRVAKSGKHEGEQFLSIQIKPKDQQQGSQGSSPSGSETNQTTQPSGQQSERRFF